MQAENCEDCADGKKMILNIDSGKNVLCKEWNYIDNKFQALTQSKCVHELLENSVSQCDIALTHINIKQIQSVEFQADLENLNVCVLQVDFAMSYTCECQNEIQSALWIHQRVMLFTYF